MPILKKQDFYNTFHQANQIPDCYESITFAHGEEFYTQSERPSSKAYAITLFPKYFDFTLSNPNFRIHKIGQTNLDGFAINLNGYNSIDAYLKENIKSKTRSPILRRIKRLEHCFDVEYKLYYGEIEKDNYHHIMQTLKRMLETRFLQKNDSTEILDKWDEYYDGTFEKIKNKEASLFVTYASNQTVAISINYHINKVFVGHIFCYDISYAKFSLGNMMVYKLLEWCCSNNYAILDMGNGDLEYKQVWCNNIYSYDYHFIYYKKSFLARTVIGMEKGKIKLKNFLKTLKVDELYKKLKNRKPSANGAASSFPHYLVEKVDAPFGSNTSAEQINLSSEKFEFLRKPINDFLYLTKEHFNNLKVYQLSDKTFIFHGAQNGQKVIME